MNGIKHTINDLDPWQMDLLAQGGIFVVLTPDDITLKLLRDNWRCYENNKTRQ